MDNEAKIRLQLYNKIRDEFQQFINELKMKNPEEIISRSYEKIIKEEMLEYFYPEDNYDIEKIKALNKYKHPLEELYQNWLQYDVNIYKEMDDCICDTLRSMESNQKEKNKSQER